MRLSKPLYLWVCTALILSVLLGCQAAPAPAPTQAPAATKAPSAPTAAAGAAAQPTTAAPAAASQPTAAAPAAASTVAMETLKIGISAALTGASARDGLNTDRYIRMAIDDVNAAGGVKVGGKAYRLEAVTVDNKSTPDGGRESGNRLVLAEKVKFILGAQSTPTTGIQTVSQPNKVLLLSVSATDKSLSPDFPLTLQIGLPHMFQRVGASYAWFSKNFPSAKRLAIVVSQDPTGQTLVTAGNRETQARGMSIVATDFFPLDLKDFEPLVTRVLRQNPDVIQSSAGGREALFLSMAKTLSDQGYKGAVFGAGGAQIAMMKQAGQYLRTYAEATLSDWSTNIVSSGERAMLDRQVAKYGIADVNPLVMGDYNQVLVLKQAMEKAGTVDDAEKIAQVMIEGEWDTMAAKEWGKSKFLGAKTFGRAAVLDGPVYLTKVENGQVNTFSSERVPLP